MHHWKVWKSVTPVSTSSQPSAPKRCCLPILLRAPSACCSNNSSPDPAGPSRKSLQGMSQLVRLWESRVQLTDGTLPGHGEKCHLGRQPLSSIVYLCTRSQNSLGRWCPDRSSDLPRSHNKGHSKVQLPLPSLSRALTTFHHADPAAISSGCNTHLEEGIAKSSSEQEASR